MKRRRRTWLVYACCSAAVVGAMVAVSLAVLGLEERAHRERREAEVVRWALLRAESVLAPMLSRESSRPYFHYASFYPANEAYARMMRPLEMGDVPTPSPLLDLNDDWIRLHFQLDEAGRLTTPSLPSEQDLRIAAGWAVAAEPGGAARMELDALRGFMVGAPEIQQVATCTIEDTIPAVQLPFALPQRDEEADSYSSQKGQKAQTWSQAEEQALRSKVADLALNAAPRQMQYDNRLTGEQTVAVGPLLPFWIEEGAPARKSQRISAVGYLEGAEREGDLGPRLLLARAVDVGERRLVQGMWLDWDALRGSLEEDLRDLLPEATFVPRSAESRAGASDGTALMVASLPMELSPGRIPVASIGLMTPTRVTLGVAWVCVVLSVVVTGLALRALVELGERRGRFVSAVTHELRTPLTTFRLYAQMLADGMVKEEGRKQEYLTTLDQESERLTRIVDNVLSYARLTDRPSRVTVAAVDAGEMLERVEPRLKRRAEECAAAVSFDCGAARGRRVRVDVESVERILMNLVDNACKYGCVEGSPAEIEVGAAVESGSLALSVRDHGPGIERGERERVFRAFTRAGDRQSDTTKRGPSGLGLGLALARDLAREMGGELELRDAEGGGARFVLSLPLVG